jgi:hypothetical protein
VGVLNNQKQYNMMTVDANPNNQEINIQLLFDDNNGNVAPIDLGSFTGPDRKKYQFIVNSGMGQQAYRVSPVFSADVTAAPIIYQAEIYAAVLADNRSSYDSYWQSFGSNESKLAKQGFFDYSTDAGNTILVQLFADGNMLPYYVFTLATNTARSEVPMRVRFPAIKFRLWRIIMTSVLGDGSWKLWSPVQVDAKQVKQNGGYTRSEITEGMTP